MWSRHKAATTILHLQRFFQILWAHFRPFVPETGPKQARKACIAYTVTRPGAEKRLTLFLGGLPLGSTERRLSAPIPQPPECVEFAAQTPEANAQHLRPLLSLARSVREPFFSMMTAVNRLYTILCVYPAGKDSAMPPRGMIRRRNRTPVSPWPEAAGGSGSGGPGEFPGWRSRAALVTRHGR
jgi:hypothetical protein